MTALASVHSMPSTWQVTVGAEGIAAAQFARYGFDVSVQSGRDKPWYDLVVAKQGYLLKVSVKGSDDGSWALTQSFLKRASDVNANKAICRGAIDQWVERHGLRSLCCLVQFKGVSIDELPRVYVASPREVAQKLRETTDRLGISTLYERYEWISPVEGIQNIETLPSNWGFSERRIQELLAHEGSGLHLKAMPPKAESSSRVWRPLGTLSVGSQSATSVAAT